ncbi:hypothetical protein C8F04DRAFT_952847 [Mycena alexandri]|uniref:MYND-type domain-containing protein n=1 Tax=Mycena alexandri TaxID=1745969 RepID=A0AAD6T1N8_9AGAR|nr:hypothetical protein C8F04DRAFT_952847 [Mycena alexandri]
MSPAVQPACISECQLVNWEIDTPDVKSLIKINFETMEEKGGSPYQKWFRSVATGKDAVVADTRSGEEDMFDNCRLIAWKTGKAFKPENLFFRTVDCGRLLPMHLAPFRVQIYGHDSCFKKLDEFEGGRRRWASHVLSCYIHRICVLRNMHGMGGADIPIVLTLWDDERTKRALEYWVDFSKGEWSREAQERRFEECDAFCRRQVIPSFLETDKLVRALLSDPEVGYVPPFIMFHSLPSDGNTCVLFTKPLHVPSPSLTKNGPASCNAKNCHRDGCSRIDIALSRSLVDKSHMVREWDIVHPKRTMCNLWICQVQHSSDTKLQRCQRCKEVFYCSSAHQTLDWRVHKNVCEKRS